MEFDFAVIGDNWRFLAYGVWITILLSMVSGFASLAAGLVIALLRLYGPGWLRVPIVLYIDSMRAIPVLVVHTDGDAATEGAAEAAAAPPADASQPTSSTA